jgi:hypothetical protein
LKNLPEFVVALVMLSSLAVHAQSTDSYMFQNYKSTLGGFYFHQRFRDPAAVTAEKYQDIEGSPYLDPEFREGIIWLEDTTAVLLPLRYNIYTDEMEYRLEGVNYVIGNTTIIKAVGIGPARFLFLAVAEKGCYVEVLDSGRCDLLLKRSVRFKPGEGTKPIVGTPTPAEFIRSSDAYFIRVKKSEPVAISNIKSIIMALQDEKDKVESFIAKKKIRRASKENLLMITRYFNSLSPE